MIFSSYEEKDIDSFIAKKDKEQDILDELIVKIDHSITSRKIINVDNRKR